MTFFARAMYVIRLSVDLDGVPFANEVVGEATLNAARNGRAAYSERSRIINEGEPGPDKSIPETQFITTTYMMKGSWHEIIQLSKTLLAQVSAHRHLDGNQAS